MRKMALLLLSLIMISALMLTACLGGGKHTEETSSKYSIVDDTRGSLIVVRDDQTGLRGGIDASGNLVVPCEYESLSYMGTDSYGDRYMAQKNGQYGVIDEAGEEVIPCEYKNMDTPPTLEEEVPFKLADDLVIISKNGKEGFCSLRDGEIVIEPEFIDLNFFNGEELAVANTGGKLWGYINRDGEMVIPEQFSDAGDFCDGLATVRDENGKVGIIDLTGKAVIPIQYDDFYEYNDDGYAVAVDGDYEEGCRYIAIDPAGNEILSSDNPISIYGNLYAEYIDDAYYVLYNRKGEKVSEEKYSDLAWIDGGIHVYNMNEKAGLLDYDGNLLLPCEYDRIDNVFHDEGTGRYIWEVRFAEDGYCKLINEQGEEIPTGDYDEIGSFSETGLAPVLHEGRVGFINLTGKEVIPCDYYPATWSGTEPEEGYKIDSYNLSAVRIDGEDHYAIMDKNGEIVTDYIYSYVSDRSSGTDTMSTSTVLVVKKDGDTYGIVGLDGKEIAPCGSFCEVGQEFENGLILVREYEDQPWCLMNPDGEIVSDPVFEPGF